MLLYLGRSLTLDVTEWKMMWITNSSVRILLQNGWKKILHHIHTIKQIQVNHQHLIFYLNIQDQIHLLYSVYKIS